MGIFDWLFRKSKNKDIQRIERRKAIKSNSEKNNDIKQKKSDLKKDDFSEKDIEKFKYLNKKKSSIRDFYMSMPDIEKKINKFPKISRETLKREIQSKVINKNDLAIYALLRCIRELMASDGKITTEEEIMFVNISNKYKKKLSKRYRKNSEEYKFLYPKFYSPSDKLLEQYKFIHQCRLRSSLVASIQTQTKKQLNNFFKELIIMSISDRSLDNQEAYYLRDLYKDVFNISEEEGMKMLENTLKELELINNKPSKEEVVNQYKRDNDLPDTLETAPGGLKMFKRDMTGLMAYFKEMTNMERIFNELTGAIRNGYTVEKYLKDANLMDDPEIREIATRGFNDVAGFLKDMLEINENPELRKDYDACMEAVKILKGLK